MNRRLVRDTLICAAVFVGVFLAVAFFPVIVAAVLWVIFLLMVLLAPVAAVIRARTLRRSR